MANRRQFVRGAAGVAAFIGVAATAPRPGAYAQSTPEASPAAGATPYVAPDISTLPLKTKGQLTIHADQPLYPPWFEDNDPTNGKGFESALSYAIGERMGFTKDQIKWGYTAFNSSYAPGPKDFDFYITEVGITDARKEAVDFSDPYYQSPLVVVTKKDSPLLAAKSVSELSKYAFGTQIGTIYSTYIQDTIKPEKQTLVYNTNADSLQALENGQVDAVLEDLEIGIYNVTIQFQDLALGGILPGVASGGEGRIIDRADFHRAGRRD